MRTVRGGQHGLKAAFVSMAMVAQMGCGGDKTPAVMAASLEPATPLVIRDVSVFSGLSNHAEPNQDVWVDGQTIRKINPAGEDVAPSGTVEIDGKGQTLLPGFIDLHVHMGSSPSPPWKLALPDPNLNASKFLYAGITTAFDVGSELEAIADLKANILSGEVAGPDLYIAGPHVAIEGGHPQAMVDFLLPWPINRAIHKHLTFKVKDESDIDDAIASIKETGGDLVKVTIDEIPLGAPHLDAALLSHAVTVAHDAGLKVGAHIGSEANAMMAVDAGVDVLLHGVNRDRLSPEGAARVAAAGVPVAVTIGVFHSIDEMTHEGWQPGPLQNELMDPAILAALEEGVGDFDLSAMASYVEALNAHRQDRFTNTALMAAHGVDVLVASDSPTIGWEAGVAYHKELEHLVSAGLPAGDVLRRATALNASAMGLTDRGTIEVGKRADLLLVGGDPTADITHAHDIKLVVRAGQRVNRQLPYDIATEE